ncbi:MAG TPA: tetratricopeptide repeat protein [Terriglobales bacterium]|nr:tetratricopeptide repeat protein [Terriglobales bacterium]
MRAMNKQSVMSRVMVAVLLLAVTVAQVSASANVPSSVQDLLKSGRVDEAVSELQKRIAAKSNDAEAYNLLSRAYYALENWDQAVNAGEKAVELAPNNSDYHMWLGRAYGQKAGNASIFSAPGLAKNARRHFEKAVELNANAISARTDLAEFYVEAPGIIGGGKDKARAQADVLAKQDMAVSHWVKARVAEKEGDMAAAEREYRAAVAASNNDAAHWLNLASFYRHQNRLGEMESAISSAVGKPRKPNALVDAASLLFRAGRSLPQAAQLVSRYLSGKEKSEEAPAFHAHYLLGQIMEKQGDKAGAMKEYQAALELAKNYDPARTALARLQKR